MSVFNAKVEYALRAVVELAARETEGAVQGRGVGAVTVDDQPVPGGIVPLRDDGRTHDVRVTLG